MSEQPLHRPAVVPFRILCVCTGNICRSPVAQHLIADRLGPEVEVESAGTYAVVGRPIADPLAARLRAIDLDPDQFAARQLTAQMLTRADLVLALSRGHRGDAAELEPRAVRRVFTLLEFARLLESVDRTHLTADGPAERLRHALPIMATHRRPGSDADDVHDPYGGPTAAYDHAFDLIDEAAWSIARAVAQI